MEESDRTGREATIRLHGFEPIRALVTEDLGAHLTVLILDDPNVPAIFAVGYPSTVLSDVTEVDDSPSGDAS